MKPEGKDRVILSGIKHYYALVSSFFAIMSLNKLTISMREWVIIWHTDLIF